MVQKFIKELRSLRGKYSIWEIWVDFVSICAISMANIFEKSERKEKEYLRIIRKYSPEEQQKLCGLFQLLIEEMERNPDQDALGTIFSQLGVADKRKGQFFTPYCISKLMAQITIGHMDKDDGPQLINEPACGSGANLIAAANVMRSNGFNYQQNAYFVAQDIDYTAAMMCYVQLSLLGCPGVVIIGDTLAGDTQEMEHWYTPFHYIFGESILRRKRELWKQQQENGGLKTSNTASGESWLLQLAGLA